MIRLLARPYTGAPERRLRTLLNGLYWHFPLCCVIAFLFRQGETCGHRAIYMLHPDRSIKAWVPCWWHDRRPPRGSVRDWTVIPLDWWTVGVPVGAWPSEWAR